MSRRVSGENEGLTLHIRMNYALALYADTRASLDDVREAVTALEELDRTARRVLGRAHPHATWIEGTLRHARDVLRARDKPPTNA